MISNGLFESSPVMNCTVCVLYDEKVLLMQPYQPGYTAPSPPPQSDDTTVDISVQFSGDLVTASPDVYQASLGADSEFLVLASDGLWDYINSSDAVSFVRNQLRQHGDVQLACYALAEAALATTN
ncbi:protein phosphatase 2C 57-like [Rosa chinensis]|uniref:protein phosphatase 2C 57-like n=1 Tax=Rosa chinensis TaxID=74649 RepID=UPI001AD8C760|nr:protein phosphatase 2C 57-like [Rosa chinensis]